MTIAFTPAELYNIAIAVERRGAAFYDTLARTCGNEAMKQDIERCRCNNPLGYIAPFNSV